MTPMTSLKFLNPKDISNNDLVDNMSKISDFSDENSDGEMPVQRKQSQARVRLAQSTISNSLNMSDKTIEILVNQDKNNNNKVSQSLEFDKDALKNSDLNQVAATNDNIDDELKLPDAGSEANS